MSGKIENCAWKVWKILGETGTLNLWEARAILGETRDFTCKVLLWLAARGMISYYPVDGQLVISIAHAEREASVRSVAPGGFAFASA